MLKKEINLQPGDMVYYPVHRALGLLISKELHPLESPSWLYVLRSPDRKHRKHIMTSFQSTKETNLVRDILAGRLEYYEKTQTSA